MPKNVSDNALVIENALVYGNARVYGDADIQSNDDWFSFIYSGKVLTGYRSRNKQGYELNINGGDVSINDLGHVKPFVTALIAGFTPFEKENEKKTELEKVIADLNEQLEVAKKKLESL